MTAMYEERTIEVMAKDFKSEWIGWTTSYLTAIMGNMEWNVPAWVCACSTSRMDGICLEKDDRSEMIVEPLKKDVQFYKLKSPDGQSDFQCHCIVAILAKHNIDLVRSCIVTMVLPSVLVASPLRNMLHFLLVSSTGCNSLRFSLYVRRR